MKKIDKNLKRCNWCNDDESLEFYHDFVWGTMPKTDDELFERYTQQVFQAGLSWKTIWNKNKNFKIAFEKFSIKKVSKYSEKEKLRLLNDISIIRNRLKIEATIENAKRILAIQNEFGSFKKFLGSISNDLLSCQKELKKKLKFAGPEIIRMFVFNIGKIEVPHDKHCWKFKK